MSDLPAKARWLIAAACISALALLLTALFADRPAMTTELILQMAGWSLACLLLERLSISLPTAAALSLSTVTFVPMILFLPAPLPMILSTLIIIIVELWERKPLVKIAFNAANYALSFGLCSLAWHFLSSSTPFSEQTAVGDILAVAATIVIFYTVNTGLTNAVVAFITERPMSYVWRTNDMPVVLPTISLSAIGATLAVLWHYAPVWSILTLLPITVTYLAFQQIRRLEDETREAVIAMADSIDARDPNTYQHSLRVSEYCQKMAARLRLGYEMEDLITLVARVHDLGKIGVPNQVLFKNDSLEDSEWRAMQLHPQTGAEILSKYRLFKAGTDLVLHHHEKYDGSGYPDGLKGKLIPIGSRIIAVADAYDAMVSDRPYRKGVPAEVALAEIRRCMSTQFDPVVAGTFLSIIEEEREVAKSEAPLETEPVPAI